MNSASTISLPVDDYDLALTLDSGQAFRWVRCHELWTGVVHGHWVRLRHAGPAIEVETAVAVRDWGWLENYLQVNVKLADVLATFPEDEPMRQAVVACHGLRLLRQDPWEALASFILSSSKQIVQIRQIVGLLCERFGNPLPVPVGERPAWSFPAPSRLARLTEIDLRGCKMGYRAPYLLETARRVAGGLDLDSLHQMTVEQARHTLMGLPGVGRKVADCVLLFAYGFPKAFPVDVWVMRALQQLYFPKRRVQLKRLHRFAETHFGPYSGYAQQYLFHFMRLRDKRRPAETTNS